MWKKHLLYVAYALVLIGVLAAAAAETVRIAFLSRRGGNAEIDAMNKNGAGQTRQPLNTAFDGYPAWGKVVPVSTPAPTPLSGCALQSRAALVLLIGLFVSALGSPLFVIPVSANPGQIWADSTVFTANDVVTVSGDLDRTSEDSGFPYAARVYVTRNRDTWSYGQWLTDVSGSYNVVIGNSMGSAFIGEMVWLPMLQPGRYDLVLDENQNGIYDCDPATGVCDVVVGDPATTGDYAFQVTAPVGAPVVDKTEIKDDAADLSEHYTSFPKVVELSTTAYSLASTAADYAVAWSPAAGMGISIGITIFESNVVGTSYDAMVTSMGINILKQIGGPLSAHYQALALDPPDTAYETVAELGAVPYHPALAEDGFSRAQADTANALEEQGALVAALTHSLEKLDGAQAANDPSATVRQARMVRKYADLLAANDEDSAALLGTLAGEVQNHGGDRVIRAADVTGYQQRLATSGFSTEETEKLRSSGLTGAEIASLQQYIIDMDTAGLADFNEYQVWLGLRDQTAAAVPALRSISDQAQTMIEYYGYSVEDRYPTASAGGPYTGTEGGAVTLSAAASTDPNGDALSYAWDLDGDGAFDDGSTATVAKTWSGEYRGLVGVKVTDANGHADTAYAPVRIASANRAPVMGATSPADSVVAAQPGDTVVFSAEATDPDGDAVTYRWKLAGAEVATGPSWTRTVTAADAGAFVDVVADDGNPFSTDPSTRWRIVLGGAVSEGALSVTSSPAGARIVLDGADTGRLTPAVIEGLSLGEHSVSVTLSGYVVPDAKRITVTGTGTAAVDFLLDLLPPPPEPEEYSYVDQWGTRGTGDGQFYGPFGIAVDSEDNIYVVDNANCRVQKFTSDGDFILQFGSQGTGDGQFIAPWWIAVDPATDNVYVTETGNKRRVQKFTSTGDYITQWGTYGGLDGQFYNPAGIAVDADGNVYVVDMEDGRVQKFTSTGEFITKWGTLGHADGQLYYPSGIAIDTTGNVYVNDAANLRIVKYTTDGTFVKQWETPYGWGIAVDSTGNVYQAVDYHQVRKYTPDGTLITQWGGYGAANGYFVGLHGIAVDSTGYVYTTEWDIDRVQKFALKGLAPTAGFRMSVSSGPAPLAVNFTDRSTSAPTSWSWMFGDGGTSTDQNPVHTFTAAGTYAVTLTATNAAGLSSTARHSVTVTQSTQVPVAHDDTYSTAEDQVLTEAAPGVLANDNVTGTPTLAATSPSHGTVALNPDGSFTYTPTSDFHGTDTFTYTLTSGTLVSAPATVTITVTDVNDPPAAAFTFLPTAPTTLDTVAFTDSSSDKDGTVAGWAWTFGDGGTATTQNPGHTYAAAGTYTVTLIATDDDGATATLTQSITVTSGNLAPVVAAGNDLTGTEGAAVVFSGGYTDAGDVGAHTIAWTFGDGGSASGTLTPSHTYADNGAYTVTLTVTDSAGLKASDTLSVTVANAAPVVTGVTVPANPVAVRTSVTATATFTDAGTADTHTARWTWGDGATTAGTITGATVSGTHAYTSAGVFEVTVTVTDDDGGAGTGTGTAQTFVVAYDPNGGFVTGGGWIQSPAGAYTTDPGLTGKANFGFVSKYNKGATVPTGETQFDFKAGRLDFRSTSYDWLVIAGAKAQYKGTGTINGAGNYGFMLTAVDGDVNGKGKGKPDLFRLKIWDRGTGGIVYDNKMNAPDTDDPTTVLGGGSIVIHKG